MPDKKDCSEPAFPIPVVPCDDQGGFTEVRFQGMTLRDAFAIAALNQRKALSYGGWYAADAAREAYEIADAMMKARNQ